MEFSKVTSAIWGSFDQYVITGHADGTVAKYDLLEVSCSVCDSLWLQVPMELKV